jgi:hypothetical protein
MVKNRIGLTILESLVLMTVCIVLLWVSIPIVMVRLGWKDVGAMVVTEGDKAPDYKGVPLDPSVLQPRVKEIEKPVIVVPDAGFLPKPPSEPAKKRLLE